MAKASHEVIIDQEIERWKQNEEPAAHGAVCELLFWRELKFSIKDIEKRYDYYHKRNWPDLDKGVKSPELRKANGERRVYKRQALRELGKLIRNAEKEVDIKE